MDLLGTGDFYVTGAPAPGILLCRGLELTCGLRVTGGGSWRDILNCRTATGAHVAMNLRYAIPSVDTPPLIVVVVIVVSVVIAVVTVGTDWRSANFRCRHTAIYPSLGRESQPRLSVPFPTAGVSNENENSLDSDGVS